jgi:hypothetical protein
MEWEVEGGENVSSSSAITVSLVGETEVKKLYSSSISVWGQVGLKCRFI